MADTVDQVEAGDKFGYSLVAIPGSVVLFADGFERGNTSTWSSTVSY